MKKINSKLSSEQKLILFEEATERPGSSILNEEKREGSYHCVNCDVKLFDSSSKYESGSGWPSFYDSYPMCLKQKLTIILVMQEQNIIVRNVADIMDTYLRTDLNQQGKDIVITLYVWCLKKNIYFNFSFKLLDFSNSRSSV